MTEVTAFNFTFSEVLNFRKLLACTLYGFNTINMFSLCVRDTQTKQPSFIYVFNTYNEALLPAYLFLHIQR